MNIEARLGACSETAVVYRYLDLLAARVAALEQQAALSPIEQLREENRQMREQLALPYKPDLHQLLLFLSLVYENFWERVRLSDLAVLAEMPSVPHVPVSGSKPSAESIARVKREFMLMPASKQAQLKDFCKRLPSRLTPHPEMRALLEESHMSLWSTHK